MYIYSIIIIVFFESTTSRSFTKESFLFPAVGMAKRPGTVSPTAIQQEDFGVEDLNSSADTTMDHQDGSSSAPGAADPELSLEEILSLYSQPINEEQAWAVCYQCCSGLRVPRPPAGRASRVKDPSSILLHRDGTVSLQQEQRLDGRATAANFQL